MAKLRIINGVMDHLMVRLVEWCTATILFLFGFTLLEPGKTFSSPAYKVLADLAVESVWGWAFCLIAGVRLASLISDALFPRSALYALRVRAASATVCCVAWLTLALGLYLANPGSPGSRTYTALCLVDMITAFYLGRQADRHGRTMFMLRP